MLRKNLIAAFAVLGLAGAALVPAWADSAKDDGDTLRAATLLFRHSVVSPKFTAPKSKTQWPMGLRQLTALGIREMYQTGQALRRKYVDELGLVSGGYKASEIYVRASNTDRSLQSAQMLALGMFPLGTGPDPAVYDKALTAAPAPELAFNPVPVHSVALENDAVLRPYAKPANCKAYRTFKKSLSKTKLYRDQGDKYRDLLQRVSTITGMYEGKAPSKILHAINEIHEVINADLRHKLPIPEGISLQDVQEIKDLSDWNYHHWYRGKGVGQLLGSGFLTELTNHYTAIANGDPKARKFYLYAGHQGSILGVEAGLGIEMARAEGPLFIGRVPSPASRYVFELHEPSKGSFAIRLKFVSSEDGSERLISIPGCDGEMCPLKRFADLVAKITPRDWRAACKT